MELLNQYMGPLISLLVVLALVIVAMLLFKSVGGVVRGRRGQRLGISEYHVVDKTRRLVLVRRDDVEHLVMIGGPQDIVIENGIGSRLSANAEIDDDLAPPRPLPMRAAPRPPVFGDKAPPLRAVDPPLRTVRDPDEP